MATTNYKTENIKLPNGVFVFTSIAEPVRKYQSQTEMEYKCTFVMSEDDAYSFKDLKLNKTVKEVKTSEFEQSFKCPPPFPSQKYQYMITVTQNLKSSSGKDLPEFLRPKTFLVLDDGSIVEKTSTLVGNGSKGTLSLLKQTNLLRPDDKPTVKLSSILVTSLIPYEKKSTSQPWDQQDLEIAGIKKQQSSQPSSSTSEEDEELPF